MTKTLARRVEAAEADMVASEIEALAKLPGNPYGAEVRRFGNAVVLTSSEVPRASLYNRILGAGPGDEEGLNEAVSHMQTRGLRPRVDVSPLNTDSAFLQRLTEKGFALRGFQVALFADAGAVVTAPPAPGVTVDVAATPEEVENCAAILVESFGSKDRVADFFKDIVRVIAKHPEHRLYLARVDGVPAGAASLHVAGATACLEVAGTLPAFRGRGAQTALLHARIADAKALGCDLVVSQTGSGSVSQNNMERVGLRIAFTKAELFLG